MKKFKLQSIDLFVRSSYYSGYPRNSVNSGNYLFDDAVARRIPVATINSEYSLLKQPVEFFDAPYISDPALVTGPSSRGVALG